MAQVLFSTLGSWGDLFPLVGIALELRRRGHQVEITASPAWADLVSDAGIRFTPTGRHIGFDEFAANPEIFGRMPFALRTVLQRFMFDQIDELSDDLREPVARADLVVCHPAHIAALDVAESAGAPTAVATVFPAMLPSSSTVPGGTAIGPWTGPHGRAVNRLVWASANFGTSLMFDRPINSHRRRLGLSPVRNALLQLPLRTRAILVLADPAVVIPATDWPDHVHVTSFVAWDEIDAGTVSSDVEEFLAAGDPPVLITLGASTSTVADDFFPHTTELLLDRGARVLAVSGPAPPVADVAPGRVLCVDYLPFSSVLPRCRGAIHHAGIGTTVAVLRAGLPQVAVPMSHDQPDTARLVTGLGVGVAVPWKRRKKQLGRAVDRLLDDADLADASRGLAHDLRDRDGATSAADVIEALLDS